MRKIIGFVLLALLVGCAAWLLLHSDSDRGYKVRWRFNDIPEQTAVVDGIRWHYGVSDGQAVVIKACRCGSGPFSEQVTVPATLGGRPVTTLYGSVFRSDDPVRKLTIPEGVTDIEVSALSGVHLRTLSLPASVLNLELCGHVDTEYVVSPDNPRYCARNGFLCTKDGTVLLKGTDGDAAIPDGVVKIDDTAFWLRDVRSVTLPASVESIGTFAFRSCTNLTSVVLPASVKEIGAFAFQDCTALEQVELSPGLTDIPAYAFEGCTSLKTIVIPDSVTNISYYAFANCTNVESATLPASVKTIGHHAFSCCGFKMRLKTEALDVQIAPNAFSLTNDLSAYRGILPFQLKYYR